MDASSTLAMSSSSRLGGGGGGVSLLGGAGRSSSSSSSISYISRADAILLHRQMQLFQRASHSSLAHFERQTTNHTLATDGGASHLWLDTLGRSPHLSHSAAVFRLLPVQTCLR